MSAQTPEPVRLGTQRAKRMLRDLQDAPFVVLAFTDGELRIYTKGLDDAAMRKVEELVEDLAE